MQGNAAHGEVLQRDPLQGFFSLAISPLPLASASGNDALLLFLH